MYSSLREGRDVATYVRSITTKTNLTERNKPACLNSNLGAIRGLLHTCLKCSHGLRNCLSPDGCVLGGRQCCGRVSFS